MEILALTILILSFLAGFIAIFFTTFGTLIILCGTVAYSLLTAFEVITYKELAILLTLYLCGEVLEYVCIIIGAKKLGASNKAVVGALVGGILGAIFGAGFLGIGLILGTFFGIFAGAFIVEWFLQKDLIKSLKAGAGGVLGRVGSIAAKVFIAFAMLIVIIVRLLNG